MVTVFLIVLGALAVTLGIVAVTGPRTFLIERSTFVDAAPEAIFGRINDFRQWLAWSPWEALDPDLRRQYSGASSGVGAVYEWQGNRKAGSGRMEILESVPDRHIVIRLDFLKPFRATNTTIFRLEREVGGTRIVWTMSGPQPLPFRLMGMVFNLDDAVGKDFEAGLDRLKALCA